MFKLTGFGDEISPDLDEQLRVLASEGIRYLEFRGAWNQNVMKLSALEIEAARQKILFYGFQVSALASPIGKVKVDEEFGAHWKLFERSLEIAEFLGTRFVRVFSYYPPEGKRITDFQEEIFFRMQRKAEWAAQRGFLLLHENEQGIYGETANHCLEIHQAVSSPQLRAAFDFANFVVCGEDPFRAFQLLRPYVAYLHVKDAVRPLQGEELKIVPAGAGDGHIAEILSEVMKDGKDYFLSLEPHLSFAGSMYGRSGPELFTHAIRALKDILNRIGAQWQ